MQVVQRLWEFYATQRRSISGECEGCEGTVEADGLIYLRWLETLWQQELMKQMQHKNTNTFTFFWLSQM